MKESVRVMRFMIVGTMNFIILTAVIGGMMYLDCNYIAANIVGYAAALTNNFFWSKYWIFTARDGRFEREIPVFLLAFALAYGVQFVFLLFFAERLDMNKYVAQFVGVFFYGAINFVVNRRVTFAAKKRDEINRAHLKQM